MISKLIKKYKAQIGDSLWSLMGLVLMNAVAQLLVFPVLDQLLGLLFWIKSLYHISFRKAST